MDVDASASPVFSRSGMKWGRPLIYSQFADQVRKWVVAFDGGDVLENFCIVIHRHKDQLTIKVMELNLARRVQRALLFFLPAYEGSETEEGSTSAQIVDWHQQVEEATPFAKGSFIEGEVTFTAKPTPFGIGINTEQTCVILIKPTEELRF